MRGSTFRALVWTVVGFGAVALLIVVFFLPDNTNWVPGLRKTKLATKMTLLSKTVSALERAVDHLFVVSDNINVDGVFGVRLVGEQLSAVIQQVEKRGSSIHQNLGVTSLLERISKLTENAQKFTQEFGPMSERTHPQEYEQLQHLMIAGSWDMWFPARDVDRRLMPTYGYELSVAELLDPRVSDECLKQPYDNKCNFTEKCWNEMTAPSYHAYSLTHEIFFLLIAFANGCTKQVNKAALQWKQVQTDDLLATECAAVLHEAELIAEKDFPIYRRDLFMEQTAFCGLVGYRDFFRDDWLNKILGWQSERGCYTMNITEFDEKFEKDFPRRATELRRDADNRKRRQKRHAQTLREANRFSRASFTEPKLRSRRRHRQKRNEQVLRDGCMAHVTAVAMAALGQHVRYLLEPLLDDGSGYK